MNEELAIDGGHPVRTVPFPKWPVFDEREVGAVVEVTRSGQWGILTGAKVKAFEREFAAFQQAKYGTCVVNGTAALEIAMRALDIAPRDEVITTPYTFIATPNAGLLVGATPVFVDIEPDTYLIDAARIEEAITERTKAIVPVHIGGCPADMDAIMGIAKRYDLAVVEDACQAWGAEWNGHRVGAIGDVGAFSFQASKNITAGEGGIVVTNDAELADRVWSLHNVGRRKGGLWYEHVRLGWNYRMTEWQGAVLLVQLTRLPEQRAIRDENARYLTEQLSKVEGIQPLRINPRVTQHGWHLFIFRYQSNAFGGLTRDDFIDALRAEGIPCSPGYLPLNRSEAMVQELSRIGAPEPHPCPIAEHACYEEAVWLTQNMLLGTRGDMDTIVEAIAKIKSVKG